MTSAIGRALGGLSKNRPPTSPLSGWAVPLSTFKMIGLADIQAQVAHRGPGYVEKLYAIAENTISKHLIRGDAFERHGNDSYLVLFATLGAEEAEFKSRLIAKELAEHLLGENDGEAFKISTLCTTIPVASLGTVDQETAIAEALKRASPPGQPRSPSDRSFAGAEAHGETGQGPAEPYDGNPSPANSDEEAGSTNPYSPLWDVTQMTMLRFRAGLAEIPGGDLAQESEFLQRDLIVIRSVTEDLRILLKRGRRLPVTIPIHHVSLGSVNHRARIYQALAEAPQALRKLITVEICSPPEDFWTYACQAFLEMARPLGMRWSALIPLERQRLIPAPRSWLTGVSSVLLGEQRSEAKSLRLMTEFGQRCRSLSLECAIYGINSRALVLGAVGAGFRYLSGAAIQPDVAGIANATRFEPLDLYRDLVPRAPISELGQ